MFAGAARCDRGTDAPHTAGNNSFAQLAPRVLHGHSCAARVTVLGLSMCVGVWVQYGLVGLISLQIRLYGKKNDLQNSSGLYCS